MKRYNLLLAAVLLLLSACSEEESVSEGKRDPATQAVLDKHEEISQAGILADFVRALSAEDYGAAASALHPKLAAAWTQERFTEEWQEIRRQAGEGWGPAPLSTFSGTSAQGPYEQASYRLLSDWRSRLSLDLTAMEVEGAKQIVQIHMRVPYAEAPPPHVAGVSDAFISALLQGDTPGAQQMIASPRRAQYPVALLERLAPLAGTAIDSSERSYYRFSANTVWYDAVRLSPPDQPAAYLELALETRGDGTAQIVFLSFKLRP